MALENVIGLVSRMTVKEAIDILERSCGFHYNATDKCYGCLFENSGWCGDDFHESLLAILKEQEVKAGHWIDTTNTIGFPRCECSECNSEAGAIWMKYCPNCGAKTVSYTHLKLPTICSV